jgi:hypothetical protein
VLGIDRGARHPCRALGVEGPTPRRAGVSPPRVRQVEPAAGRRRRGGAEPAPVRSCSMQWPRKLALLCGVVASRGPCPPSRHRPRGSAGRAEAVDIGRHRVVREARLSTGVHCGVPLHELPLAQRFVSAVLEGEVGEVVGDEPKMLLRRV